VKRKKKKGHIGKRREGKKRVKYPFPFKLQPPIPYRHYSPEKKVKRKRKKIKEKERRRMKYNNLIFLFPPFSFNLSHFLSISPFNRPKH